MKRSNCIQVLNHWSQKLFSSEYELLPFHCDFHWHHQRQKMLSIKNIIWKLTKSLTVLTVWISIFYAKSDAVWLDPPLFYRRAGLLLIRLAVMRFKISIHHWVQEKMTLFASIRLKSSSLFFFRFKNMPFWIEKSGKINKIPVSHLSSCFKNFKADMIIISIISKLYIFI